MKGVVKAILDWLRWGKARYDALPEERKKELKKNAAKLADRVLKK